MASRRDWISILGWLLGPILGPVLAVLGCVIALILMVGIITGGFSTAEGVQSVQPSAKAVSEIPPDILRLCQSAADEQSPDIPWYVICGVLREETAFGRSTLPGVHSGVNTYGCCAGYAQFSLVLAGGDLSPGRLRANETNSSTWGTWSVDGNKDGWKDVYDPEDSIPSAAKYLEASSKHPNTGTGCDLPDVPVPIRQALWAYNHACWYVREVMDHANSYRSISASGGGVTGQVEIAPLANAGGREITPETMAFLEKVAGLYGKKLIVTTGTNHPYYTVDGKVSDHSSGHAADIGMIANGGDDDSPVGDAIMTACLEASGIAPAQAVQEARAGGLYTLHHGGLRIQCIWKTLQGGNHHNHVHIGARPG